MQMSEILAGFQRLELRRTSAVRDALLRCFTSHRNQYAAMLEQTDSLILAMENISPEKDCQYFLKSARTGKSAKRAVHRVYGSTVV